MTIFFNRPIRPLRTSSQACRVWGLERSWAAGLENPLIVPHGIDHRPALLDGQGQRFFAVDVLAGLGCGDRHQGVPMIGHHDRHNVDARTSEQVAKIVIGVAAPIVPECCLRA